MIAWPILGLRAQLQGVAVRELKLQLVAVVELFDVWEEGGVVGEADMHAGTSVYALAGGVEGLDDERNLLGAGGGGRFVDLNPICPSLDEAQNVRTDHVTCRVHAEPPPGLAPLLRGGTEERAVPGVVLIVGPIHDGVGAGEGDLDLPGGVGPDKLVLL